MQVQVMVERAARGRMSNGAMREVDKKEDEEPTGRADFSRSSTDHVIFHAPMPTMGRQRGDPFYCDER